MSSRSDKKLAAAATAALASGEQLTCVFTATTGAPADSPSIDDFGHIQSPGWILFDWLLGRRRTRPKVSTRLIAVTDRRILVLDGPLGQEGLVRELPRRTRLGPATDWPAYATDRLGEPLIIIGRYFSRITDADLAIGFTDRDPKPVTEH